MALSPTTTSQYKDLNSRWILENQGTLKVNNSSQLASWKLKKIEYTNIVVFNTPSGSVVSNKSRDRRDRPLGVVFSDNPQSRRGTGLLLFPNGL